MATVVERVAALAIGRVELVTVSEIKIALFDETPQATALNTGVPTGFPRINAYVLIPNESGAVVAVVKEIFIYRQSLNRGVGDDSLVDLPFPARLLIAVPFGTLERDEDGSDGRSSFSLERGVPVLPSVGEPVLLPTATQLKCIVEAKEEDRLIQLGTAPFAGNARVWVHPDRLFGRHLAILGNTGSGKSCSVAGLVRWSVEAVTQKLAKMPDAGLPNTRFIILDPNGEYADAFKDGQIPSRRFAVDGADGARRLTVPGWLWNGQEWAAITSAQPGAQRPTLFSTLRLLKNTGSSLGSLRAQVVRRYQRYIRHFTQLHANAPDSIFGFPNNKNCGDSLEGLVSLMVFDETRLQPHADTCQDIINSIAEGRGLIDGIRVTRTWGNGARYNDFQPNDLESVIQHLETIVGAFPPQASVEGIGEDAPIKFAVNSLPECIREVALVERL